MQTTARGCLRFTRRVMLGVVLLFGVTLLATRECGAQGGLLQPNQQNQGSALTSGGLQQGGGLVSGSSLAGANVSASGVPGLLMGKLGLSPTEASQLVAQLSNGTLSPEGIQLLCAHAGSVHVSADELTAFGHAAGLSDAIIGQLQSCMQSPSQAAANSAPAATSPGTATAPVSAIAQQVSSIEQSFRQMGSGQALPGPSSGALTQYGYGVFTAPVSTFAPVDNVPVGPDYVLGPGDQFNLILWGSVNQTLTLTVQRDGSILVPQIGPLSVAGLTFGQAKDLVEGRAKQINGVFAELTMGQIRTIQVFVLGAVNQPGVYTISALSHLSSALVAAGGISKVGSLRRVELRRGNSVVRAVDLYDLLMRGNRTDDERLQADDVVFVPVIGPVVAVVGDVKQPAIYELSSPTGATLRSIISLAGGFTAFSYGHRITVERVENHLRMVALDIRGSALGSESFRARDGDLVEVYPVLPERRNIVTLAGNVYRSGDYEWHPGMRVSDLIGEGQGVKKHTFFDYALIKRESGPDRRTTLVPVDLEASLNGGRGHSKDLILQPLDELTILSEDDVREKPTVEVTGEVRNPGSYPWFHSMKVSDLIYMAGGLKDDAYRKEAQLARTRVMSGRTIHSSIHLDLEAALSGSNSNDPALERNDQLYVSMATDWHPPWTVNVAGRVRRPGTYPIYVNEHLEDLLAQCGGFAADAFPQGMVFTRASVQQLEQDRLEKARDELKQQVAQLTLTTGTLAQASGSSGMATAAALSSLQSILTSSENLKADGRIVVHLRQDGEPPRPENNLLLQDKDTIVIPRWPSSVAVLGQVYNPTSIIATSSWTVRDYLSKAGGATQTADTDHIMVIKADGSVITEEGKSEAGKSYLFPLLPVVSGGIMSEQLAAGDTIYVPPELNSFITLGYTKDVTQIISQSAMSMAILAILANSL